MQFGDNPTVQRDRPTFEWNLVDSRGFKTHAVLDLLEIAACHGQWCREVFN